jgi:single-strand DNA-binding protein
MADLNKVFLLGNLTRDPEMRYVPSGSPVCSFGLACNRRYTAQDGQKKEETLFVDIDGFGKTAELCSQYLSKGRQVLIEGRLKFRRWEAQDGQKRSKISVVAERVTFLGGRGGESKPAPAQDSTPEEEPTFMPDDDDVPF